MLDFVFRASEFKVLPKKKTKKKKKLQLKQKKIINNWSYLYSVFDLQMFDSCTSGLICYLFYSNHVSPYVPVTICFFVFNAVLPRGLHLSSPLSNTHLEIFCPLPAALLISPHRFFCPHFNVFYCCDVTFFCWMKLLNLPLLHVETCTWVLYVKQMSSQQSCVLFCPQKD